MVSQEIHLQKYRLFKRDAENKENSIPTRIEATFEACFHLIEACMAKEGLHINKHNQVRSMIAEYGDVFGENCEIVWRAFQELENQIRPGQAYGGRINGPQLKRAQDIIKRIEDVCNIILQNT
jgi:tRNA U34 5-methylaminomethyl-2-thiouridine-forming methyltransferase MnmC